MEALFGLIHYQTLIKFGIWCTCWFLISYFLEFGSIFLCISIIYFIFNNLGKRKDGEISAYSMFNSNYERIAGTFDGSFYENMLRGKKNKPTFDAIKTNKKNKNKNKNKKIKHPKRMNKSANKLCPCGSNIKYKKCCLKIKRKQQREKIKQQMHSDRYHFSSSSDSSSSEY